MSLTLFEETFIYGNLELVYKPCDIIKINLVKSKLITNITFGFIWRFYVNMKFLLYSNQYIILKKLNESKIIFDFLFYHINYYEEKLEIKNYDLEKNISIKNCFKCIVITLLKDINNNFLNLSDNNIKEYFYKFSYKFKNYYDQNCVIHYNLPFEDNNWTPNWSLYIDNENITLFNIDMYIDTYFKNNKIVYNLYLKDNIKILYRRLKNLNTYTKIYKKYIFEKLNLITQNLFYSFPLNIIYKDYINLLEFDNTFIPEIIENKKIVYNNENIWILSIIPENIRCYMLGIPIFSSDIISIKNQKNIIEKIKEISLDVYLKKIYKKNKYIINHLLFDLPVGNNTDDDQDFVDISYNNVYKYNIDDIIINFNNGISHIFTCAEFDELSKKKQNFYNREPFKLLEKVNYNLKKKKELVISLNNRHVDLNLNLTLEENFNNLKEILESNDNFFIEKKNFSSILDIFFNPEFNLI